MLKLSFALLTCKLYYSGGYSPLPANISRLSNELMINE
ncbi:hypothetical protein M595_3739 [Lyngbya aestuarii BL J]|uniref:Uncharacterized protein n=1 Tax=Lyngbya aestuarii BL J TaxID=1348334 RepID=U7QGE2_9CYAN|nr:hypothetical protein M595_3739 [Lyngbya aestuarii BL J]